MIRTTAALLSIGFVVLGATAPDAAQAPDRDASEAFTPPPFPRLMGMNIGKKHYDDEAYQRQLARLHYVILGFYKGWNPKYGMDRVVRNLKEFSGGKLLVGQYTVLNEIQDERPGKSVNADVLEKLDAMAWWARDAAGNRVQWTVQYKAWDINYTAWTRADADGRRFPQWMAERNKGVYFDRAPFDIWYLDNMMDKPYVKKADWNLDGKDEDPRDPVVGPAYRAGQRAQIDHIRRIRPDVRIMGNVSGDLSDPEWAGQIEGAFLETLVGAKWSDEKQKGWPAMMRRYRSFMKNTRAPHLVGFNYKGALTDYRRFRYGLASCLLDDGYYCYTDEAAGYSSVPWFDEYDAVLGAAVSAPPSAAWTNGVWRRDFAKGVALVNPETNAATVVVEPGLRRIRGTQDPSINDGSPAVSVRLEAKDGLLLLRE